MKQYMLSKNGSEMGPYQLHEVINLITKREVELFDYVYDEGSSDWILLTEHADITKALKAQKPKAPPVKKAVEKKAAAPVIPIASNKSPHEVEWFIMKGESQFGPFGVCDLVRLMQEKTLFEFDFVWNASMSGWKRLAEIPQFSKEKIKDLLSNPESKEVFFKRQHERTPFKGRVIVHNRNEFWIAEGKEISEGGMGVFVKNSLIVPGQTLYFHVEGHDGKPGFNVQGEVVSKQFVENTRSRNQKVEYGVRFIKETQKKPEQLPKAG